MVGRIVKHAPDFLLVAGAVALSYGAWLIYHPAGFIAGGLLLIAAGTLTARKG
jgi:hypothetical protein